MSTTSDSNIMAMALPGIESNLEDPAESMVPQVLVVAILLNLIAILFCAIRLYTAKVVIRRAQLDDCLIFVALVFATAYSVIQVYETRNGAGHHIWNVSRAAVVAFHRLSMVDLAAYSLSVLFTKASILVFYLRFPLRQPIRIVVYSVMFATVAYSCAGALSWAYLCTPMERIWDDTVPGTCVNESMWWLMLSVSNVATDLAILLLPIWILAPLSLRLVKKIEMTIFLMAGGFVVEANVGIICTCLPFLKPFTKHVAPNFARRFYAVDEPQSPTVFDRAAALQSMPEVPKSTWRKSLGRQPVKDVPDPDMRPAKPGWPLTNDEPFDHVECRQNWAPPDYRKSVHAGKPVDATEMV